MEILSGIWQEIVGHWLAVAAVAGGGVIMLLFRQTDWHHRILYGLVGIASISMIWHVLIEPEMPRKTPSLEKIESNIRDWSLQAGYSVERLRAGEGEQLHYLLKTKGRNITTVNIILRDKPPERYVVIKNRMRVDDKHTELFNKLTNYEKKRFAALLEIELTNLGINYKFKIPELIILWDKILLDQMTNSDVFLKKIFLIKGAKILVQNVFVLHLEKEDRP